MSCRSVLISAVLAAGLLAPGAAVAESRVALVIGNSAYRAAPALSNPDNDARAMTEFLRSAGFEVMPASNLTQGDLRRAIGEFAEKVAGKGRDTVAVVYYAGHGVQVGGENFLIPVDAAIRSEADVALQAIRFDDLMNALETVPTKARIVILDACRNNPFAEVKKTVGRGLAMVNAPVGSVVAYSTSPGTEAEDGEGANSPFTSAFVAAAKTPGVPIEQIFKTVRLAVHDATAGRQTPWEVLSLTSNFMFFPGRTPAAPSPAPTPPAAASVEAPTPAATPVSARVVDPERVSDKPAVRSAYWKKQLRGLSVQEAYNLVVLEDDIDGYREFLLLYPKAPQRERVRVIADRRQEMRSWYTAVTANSVASYQYFLAAYGSSDLVISAQTLMQRAAVRSLLAGNDRAALGFPPCNCSVPVVPTRRAEPAKPSKPAAKPTRSATRKQAPPPREARQAPPPAQPPAASVDVPLSIGIGVGIGLGRGRGGGGGGGGFSPRGH